MVTVHFLPNDIKVEATAGELLLDVAQRAGITIETGCISGTCGTCEVYLEDGTVLRACITTVPSFKDSLTIFLSIDPTW